MLMNFFKNLKSSKKKMAITNGMSEAFEGTLKKDNVYTNDCFDADNFLEMLPG